MIQNRNMDGAQSKSYKGVVVPMVTPFLENGKIDKGAVSRIIKRFVVAKVGVFILGTTGEVHSIPVEERVQLAKFVGKQFSSLLPIYAGISSNSFQTSVELANHFYDAGIETFVAHLPFYYPILSDHMRIYYEKLVEAIPGKLLIYNIPVTTHISIPLKIIDELSYHPRIVGIKDSERDYERLQKSLQLWKNRADFSHFLGWASQSTYALSMGGDGIVPASGNLVPKLYQKLYEAAIQGDLSTADKLQQETDAISASYQKNRMLSDLIAALKSIMAHMGLCSPKVLPPLVETPKEELKNILLQLEKLKMK